MATLGKIEEAAKGYSKSHAALSHLMQDLELELSTIKQAYLPDIKSALKVAKKDHSVLNDLIEGSDDQFVKPRTITLHGIKCGLKKEKGKLVIANAESTCKLIKKNMEDSADVYIKTEEKPIKKALENLDAKMLKKIGVQVTSDSDVVVIKSIDSEIEKMVDALLADVEEKAKAA